MSLQEDLLRDLDSDEDSGDEISEVPLPTVNNGTGREAQDGEGDVEMDNIHKHRASENGTHVADSDISQNIELDSIQDLSAVSQLPSKLKPIVTQIDEYMTRLVSKKDEADFLLSVNDLAVEISNEITTTHEYIKLHYGKRYPELESLIPDPIEYSKVVKVLGNKLEMNNEALSFISKEKFLVLTISSLQAKEEAPLLQEEELRSVLKASDLLLDLELSKNKVNEYISSRLAVFAPNLSAIVGAATAAQFMNIVGGLEGLAKTQPRNIPSIGNKRSVGLGFGRTGVTHHGFLFHSEIIQQVPETLRVQAMRKVSAKLVLAARFDIYGSKPDGSYGEKLRKEINENLEKLEEPPQTQATKALPIPKDRPAKKRAGRKLRKLKQRYEASDYRKLQNRFEFGKKEATVMDAYGEEVGLGMTGSIGNVTPNDNTRAKISKGMKNRLENSKPVEDLFNQDLLNLSGKK
jgi:U4/U6 small nuclear ribonucleoprotein PRP31